MPSPRTGGSPSNVASSSATEQATWHHALVDGGVLMNDVAVDFVGELAAIQQRLAASRDMAARRLAVLDVGVGWACTTSKPARGVAVAAGASWLGAVHQHTLTMLNRHFHPNRFSYWAARLIAAFARTNGDVSRDDVSRDVENLAAAERDRSYFFSLVPVLTVATR